MGVNRTTTTTAIPLTLNTTSVDDDVIDSPKSDVGFNYIFVPSFTLVVVVLLVILVVILLQRKRRIDRLRHNLMPFYNFAPGEEDDWETELLDSDGETRREYHSISSYSSYPLLRR